MKKFKFISILVFLLIAILIALSFIKLPIKALSNERIELETQGIVSLNSSEAQSLLLLPTPKIELLNSSFSINHPNLQLDVFSSNTEFSRSILNDDNIYITSAQTTLENINTILFDNSVLLEDEIENFKIQIINKDNSTEIKSNNFVYKGAEIAFNVLLQDDKLTKISFSIEGLDINELILLLDKKYQKYFKQINFLTLDIKGEYSLDTFVFEEFNLITEDDTEINILGSLNIKNIFNSDLKISGNNFSSKILFQLFKNFDLSNIYSILPEGSLNTFDILLQGSDLNINNFEYKSNLETKINIKGNVSNLDIFNSILDIKINSSSSNEIMKIAETLLPNTNIPDIKFDQFELDALIKKNNLIVNSLTLNDEETILKASGSMNLRDNLDRNLDFKLFNFEKSDILLFYPQLSDAIKLIPGKIINFEGFLSGSDLEISKLIVLKENLPKLIIAGDIDLQKLNETFLNIKIDNITSSDLEIILAELEQGKYKNYLSTYEYDKISGNLFFDVKNKTILIDKIDVYLGDENIGMIVGKLSDQKFTGNLELQNINLSKIDQNFLKTERLNGFLNLKIESPNYSSFKNFTDLVGSINGEISIDVSDDELALVLFMQSLSQDIEDLDQINQLLETLSNSFINKKITINASIENPSKNKILLNDMSLTSFDGSILYGKIEFIESNYKITLFDIIDKDDFVIKYDNGSYSYERIIPDGTVRKPLEELIQKNINKLFENLLQ
jgi:hypothetical protein